MDSERHVAIQGRGTKLKMRPAGCTYVPSRRLSSSEQKEPTDRPKETRAYMRYVRTYGTCTPTSIQRSKKEKKIMRAPVFFLHSLPKQTYVKPGTPGQGQERRVRSRCTGTSSAAPISSSPISTTTKACGT
jgi:hypothetical protein